jgi:hypothetical protein
MVAETVPVSPLEPPVRLDPEVLAVKEGPLKYAGLLVAEVAERE